MKSIIFLLPIFALISANPIEEDVSIIPNDEEKEIIPMIEDSKTEDLPAEGRLFFVQAYATQFVTTATSTLSTYTSCYTTANAAPACLSSVLSGKRKREAGFLDETPRLLLDDGTTVDFRDYIKASRVAKSSTVTQLVSRKPEIFEASMSDMPQCLRERGPRLITVTTTITSSVAATVTSTQADRQTLKFTSAAVTDCFPMGLMASLNIPICR